MIHPGSFLDKTINNTRGKNVNANIKHSQIQEIKRNFTYKKNDDISSRFKFYSSLAKQKNSTEDVVLIGKMISDEV
ncbi:glycosyl transferase, partial [Escherichia coli]|nr:glycosyl transferase [Escherichia coli]